MKRNERGGECACGMYRTVGEKQLTKEKVKSARRTTKMSGGTMLAHHIADVKRWLERKLVSEGM